MSLQFIIGSSGAGKSYFAYERVIRESMEHPERNYYIIVPEQFTMQTQKTLVEMHPGKGILNIDILSFERLAYRVFEETGGDNRKVLEDTGKSMVLQKMVQQHRKELAYLGSQMNKPGYLDEVKSLVSEFMQYDIREENLAEMKEKAKDQPLLEMKLKDVGILYQSFREFLKGHYMTGEEVMDVLLKQLPFSEKLKGAEFLFDGFTGFTPIQVNVLRELLVIADRISVTVTMDEREDAFSPGKPYQLFFMSKQMIRTLPDLWSALQVSVSAFLYEQTDDTDTCRADQRSGRSGVPETIRTVPVCTGTCLTVSGEKYLPLQKGRVCRRTAGDKNIYCAIPPGRNAGGCQKDVRTCAYLRIPLW